MLTISLTSVRSERRKKKEGTGLVGLVHVEAMLAVIECHVAVVQAFLVLDEL